MKAHVCTHKNVCVHNSIMNRSQTVATTPVSTNDEWVAKCDVFIQWYITQPQKGINFMVNYILTKRNHCSKTSLISVSKEIEMTRAHKFPSHDSKQWLFLICF